MEDYYCVEELSDNEVIDSSDDEDFKSLFKFNESDDSEDFETEMERERLDQINGQIKNRHKENHEIDRPTNISNDQTSSSNDQSVSALNGLNASAATNEELFYDPKSDESDQKWIDSQRVLTDNSGSDRSGSEKVPIGSDATLNCPACMSLLCLDCQRHAIYRTQYRAMFVFNCRIDFSQRLQYKEKKHRKRKRNEETSDPKVDGIDVYYSVYCSQCNTRVAVYDNQQVYHFFGVLASF